MTDILTHESRKGKGVTDNINVIYCICSVSFTSQHVRQGKSLLYYVKKHICYVFVSCVSIEV